MREMFCVETRAWWILQSHFLTGRAHISFKVSWYPEKLIATLGREHKYHFFLSMCHFSALMSSKKKLWHFWQYTISLTSKIGCSILSSHKQLTRLMLYSRTRMTDFLLQSLMIILELNEFLLQSRVAHEGTIAAQLMASE